MKQRLVLTGLLVMALSLFMFPLPASASPGELHVGPEEGQYSTIQAAVDEADPYDTIIVHDMGADPDYTENVLVDVEGLTIEEADGEDVSVMALNINASVIYIASNDVTIKGFDIYGAMGWGDLPYAGICLDNVSGCTIEYNRCGWDEDYKNSSGIVLNGSDGNIVSNNICNHNYEGMGLCLYDSNNNNVELNTCEYNYNVGIYLKGSSGNDIVNNNCDYNDGGIYLDNSASNNITDNFCNNNGGECGIYLVSSDFNIITGNQVNETGGEAPGIHLDGSSGNDISGNECYLNLDGIHLDGASNDNSISGNDCSQNYNGIRFEGGYGGMPMNNTVLENNCNQNSGNGIMLYMTLENTVAGNTCNQNMAAGISLDYSTGNTISGNTCNENTGGAGIALNGGSDNTISGNTCNQNNVGIRLASPFQTTAYNTVAGNTCNDNAQGIYLDNATDNTFYLNNLSSNTGGSVYSTNSNNTWNSPTALSYLFNPAVKGFLGNYYDDYTGTDTDGDGVGDTNLPYVTDGTDDNFPLMQTSDKYALQAWYLSNPVMYRGDMSQGWAFIEIVSGESEVWISDEAAETDYTFPDGAWTGQLRFSWEQDTDSICVEVGSAIGAGDFTPGGPEATIGDGINCILTFSTNAASFTVPVGHYLALRITNNDSGSHSYHMVVLGGAWSYVSAPATSPGFPLPELPAIALLAGGLCCLGGYVLLRHRKKNTLKV